MNGVRTGGTAGFPRASNRMRGARAMPASPSPSLRPTPLGLANTHISRPQEVNPKGIPSLSPGLRAASYPGCESSKDSPTLKGLKHPTRPTEARKQPVPRYNPFRVEHASATQPRVARGSQPWAGGYNPVGIERRPPDLWGKISPGQKARVRGNGTYSNRVLRPIA
jgi:hypothetical protein